MNTYDTLSEALQDLHNKGCTYEFNLEETQLCCKALDKNYPPEEFKVIASYRFEGMSDPDDSSVVYVIETTSGEKGTLVDAYGAYAQSISLEMAQRLQMDRSSNSLE